MDEQKQLFGTGDGGPVVFKLGSVRAGEQICEVVEAGNLRDHWGYVTRWEVGTVVMIKETALEPVEGGAA